jgi:hypothetical protein
MKKHQPFRWTIGNRLSIRDRLHLNNLYSTPGNIYDSGVFGIRKKMVFEKYYRLGNSARKLYWSLHKK